MRRAHGFHFLCAVCSIATAVPMLILLLEENILLAAAYAHAHTQPVPLNSPPTLQAEDTMLQAENENIRSLWFSNKVNDGQEDIRNLKVLPPIHGRNKEVQHNFVLLLLVLEMLCCWCKVVGHPASIKKNYLHKKGEVVYNMRN